jgi:hypothetical protein
MKEDVVTQDLLGYFSKMHAFYILGEMAMDIDSA